MHFTWHHKEQEVKRLVTDIEDALSKYNAKPHFAMIFQHSSNDFEDMFGEDLEVLRKIIKEYDPEGKFRNDFMDHYIFNISRDKIQEIQRLAHSSDLFRDTPEDAKL